MVVAVLVLPVLSVALHVIVVRPDGNVVRFAPLSLRVQDTLTAWLEASTAVGGTIVTAAVPLPVASAQ
jgi:hypothetical protein